MSSRIVGRMLVAVTVLVGLLLSPVSASAYPVISQPIVPEGIIGVSTVSAAYPSVYPYADGFRDTVVFTTTIPSQSGPSVVEDLQAGSKLAVKLGTTVVKEWALTQSGTRTFSWNALNGGSIVAGTYTVQLTAIGSDSTTRTASTTVIVSAKKLVNASWSKTYSGHFFNEIQVDASVFEFLCAPALNGVLNVRAVASQGYCQRTMNITNADMRKSYANVHATAQLTVSAFRSGSPVGYFYIEGSSGSSRGFNKVKTYNFDMGYMPAYDPLESGSTWSLVPRLEVPYGAKYSISSFTLTLTYKVLK
ncbi:MAG: hypothetical protein RLZ72_33 [Actinomycetota bacterium]|jgi:hypothetical protein